jgi:hypothetical protein
MSGRPSTRSITGSPFERELETALAVQPSPEFLPRVRARIASEPPPVPWRFQWFARFEWGVLAEVLVAIIATAALVTVPGLMRGRSRVNTGDRAVLPSTPIGFTSALITTPGSRLPSSESGIPAANSPFTNSNSQIPAGVSRIPNPESGITSSEPRVLLSRAESEALWQTVVSAREGRIAISSESANASRGPVLDVDSHLLPKIAIAPISIEPLVGEPEAEPDERDGGQRTKSSQSNEW